MKDETRAQFQRTEALLGPEAMARLYAARVAVFGVGGVGGYAAEALARSGVGAIDLIDGDKVEPGNINRQTVALHSTVGLAKVDVMASRLKDINPDICVRAWRMYFGAENAKELPLQDYDYIVDAVDDVSAKVELAVLATSLGIPIISAMGAAGKLDPTRFKAADIYETRVCPLARVMRRELRARGVESLRVVYSDEAPARASTVPGSAAYVTGAAGLILAAQAVAHISAGRGAGKENENEVQDGA